MKILMTVMMMVTMTSTFAGECKLDAECKVEADCKSVNKDYAIVGGKCVNPKSKETDTHCAGIVTTTGAKGAAGDSSSDKGTGSAGTAK